MQYVIACAVDYGLNDPAGEVRMWRVTSDGRWLRVAVWRHIRRIEKARRRARQRRIKRRGWS